MFRVLVTYIWFRELVSYLLLTVLPTFLHKMSKMIVVKKEIGVPKLSYKC